MAQEHNPSESQAGVADRAAAVMRELLTGPLPTGLYVVATPIGNLADITLRALAVLAQADVLYCEDTRHSRTLLAHYAISRSTRPYHEHNAARERPRVLADLAAGKSVALISDAGTPLISDPGYKLVREAVGRRLPGDGHPRAVGSAWRRWPRRGWRRTPSCSPAFCPTDAARGRRGSRS